MFPTCKCVVLLYLSRNFIRITADHPFFVAGQGWTDAADLPGAKGEGEEAIVYNQGKPVMPNFPFVGFAAGTPLLTPEGHKPIEKLRPGDFLQPGPDAEQPDDDQGDDAHDGPEPPRWWENN